MKTSINKDYDVEQQKTSVVPSNMSETSKVESRSYFDKLKTKVQSKKPSDAVNGDNSKTSQISDLSNPKDIHQKSIHISNTYFCQTGILTPFDLFEHALYIILHLSDKSDNDVIAACQKLFEHKESLAQLHEGCRLEVTLGMGHEKARKWLDRANVPFPKHFIQFQEKKGPTGKTMPYTGGDLLLHIRSNRKDLCFELGKRFCQSIPDECITQLDDTFGYAYMSSKQNGLSLDFTGFEDGNENPKADEQRAKAALISEEDDDSIHVGGSFALTQKWKHNLTKWNGISQEEQEQVIGRTKGEESKKIRPKNPTSHVARTDLKENGVDIKVVRQSLPYGDMKEHGLFFISYASNPRKHEKQLDSMVGMGDSIHDRIMEFSTPTTGNYWYIPSIHVLKKLFNR